MTVSVVSTTARLTVERSIDLATVGRTMLEASLAWPGSFYLDFWHTAEHAQTEATCRREVLLDDMDEKRISPFSLARAIVCVLLYGLPLLSIALSYPLLAWTHSTCDHQASNLQQKRGGWSTSVQTLYTRLSDHPSDVV